MIIDAYQHVGLPRFQSPEDALLALDAAGIDRAVVCPFETCPDLASVHDILRRAPDRITALGIPLGRDRPEIEAVVRAQLDAGFAGLRLGPAHVRESPWLLDLIGEASGVALVCSGHALVHEAEALLTFLDDYPGARAWGGHFAGPSDPAVLVDDANVAALFAHERFAVVASRQALFDERLLGRWMEALIDTVGWSRLLWGSEAPVLYWRDESLEGAMSWSEQYTGTDSEARARFLGGNAERILAALPPRTVRPLTLPIDPDSLAVKRPAAMWPLGVDLDDEVAGRLVHSWLSRSAEQRGTLGQYLQSILVEALDGSAHAGW